MPKAWFQTEGRSSSSRHFRPHQSKLGKTNNRPNSRMGIVRNTPLCRTLELAKITFGSTGEIRASRKLDCPIFAIVGALPLRRIPLRGVILARVRCGARRPPQNEGCSGNIETGGRAAAGKRAPDKRQGPRLGSGILSKRRALALTQNPISGTGNSRICGSG